MKVKLVAAMMLLVVLALSGSGVVAAATLRHYLVDQVDTQLESVDAAAADHQLAQLVAGGQPASDGDPRSVTLPSSFVLAVRSADGSPLYGPTSNLLDPRQPLPVLPHESTPTGPTLISVPAVRGDGRWRVLIRPTDLAGGHRGTLLVARSLDDVDDTVRELSLLVTVVGIVGAVALGAAGYWLVRASLRPLREIEQTAVAIAAGDLSSRVRVADHRTEVGRLAHAVNAMLAHVELALAERAASESAARLSEERMRVSEGAARQAATRMRQFVADASHELRTPLTSIRGFAELHRRRATEAPGDTTRLMERIESEARRMGLLVDDMLLLARLDQERPQAKLPVDLLAVCADSVHDARAVDTSRHIGLSIGTLDPPPIVLGDEARLRQVMGNLLANALRHTPAGTPVTVTLQTRDGDRGAEAVITVGDQGPGLDADQAARVFERFYRADSARGRTATGGSGLGLSIVAAVVDGHHGRVGLTTSPGAGAEFTVRLPLAAEVALTPPAG